MVFNKKNIFIRNNMQKSSGKYARAFYFGKKGILDFGRTSYNLDFEL